MRSVKVAHLTTVHSAVDNRIFRKECRALARAGFNVTSIGPHSEDALIDQVSVKAVPRDEPRVARMTRTVWRVYREALKIDADVYHFHDPELIPIGLLLRARGRCVIYDVHEDMPRDILSKYYLPTWLRPLMAWAAERIEVTASSRFSGVVTVTPSIAKRFETLNGQTLIIYNYPCTEELMASESPAAWETRRRSVAYVGSITPERGIREMVFAMGLLSPSLQATLELAGPKVPENANPEQLSGHPGWARVRHHGQLPQRATFHLLHNVRGGLVLLHPGPNHTEALPQKIFEYMGAGLPVIASDFPLWRDILGEIGCAIFVDPKDQRAIAQAIEYILTHPSEAEEMGRRGKTAVLDRYNWDVEATKLVDFYSRLMGVCAA